MEDGVNITLVGVKIQRAQIEFHQLYDERDETRTGRGVAVLYRLQIDHPVGYAYMTNEQS